MDVVNELMARVAESAILYNGVQTGLLPKEYKDRIQDVDIYSDEERLLVIELAGEPRRLVLDELLGWQWYNSEGPEEAQGPNEALPISYGCSNSEAEAFMHRMFDKLFTEDLQE